MSNAPSAAKPTDELKLVAVLLCGYCLAGTGGECHSPGCALYMNDAPDSPLLVVSELKVEMVDG